MVEYDFVDLEHLRQVRKLSEMPTEYPSLDRFMRHGIVALGHPGTHLINVNTGTVSGDLGTARPLARRASKVLSPGRRAIIVPRVVLSSQQWIRLICFLRAVLVFS